MTSVAMTQEWLESYGADHPLSCDFRYVALDDEEWPNPQTWRDLKFYLVDFRDACDEAVEGARMAWKQFLKMGRVT